MTVLSHVHAATLFKQNQQKKNFMLKFVQAVILFIPVNRNLLILAEELTGTSEE